MKKDDRSVKGPAVIFIIGAPGSGKGTLCETLAEDFEICHLSVGDLLRHIARTENTESNKTLVQCVQRGELVPVETLTGVVSTFIDENKRSRIFIDGLPRKLDQIGPIEAAIGAPVLVLFFDCPKDVCRKRFLTRKLEGRLDDSEVFERRYKEFAEQNPGIVQHYMRRGLLLKIDTSGETYQSLDNLMKALEGNDAWKLFNA